MNFVFILLGMVIVGIFIIDIVDKRKQKKELKALQETPIEVHRFTYRIYLNDGSEYKRLARGYVKYSFDCFVEEDILRYSTLDINDSLIINTENITKVELISSEAKIIKPIMGDKWYNECYTRDKYTEKEVLEREIK